jgi:hypothetical protein
MLFPSSQGRTNFLPSPHTSLQALLKPNAVMAPWVRKKPAEQPVQILAVKQEMQ